jgi:hypothetical protein
LIVTVVASVSFGKEQKNKQNKKSAKNEKEAQRREKKITTATVGNP